MFHQNLNSKLKELINWIEDVLKEQQLRISINIEAEGGYKINENNFDENHFYNKINQEIKNLNISARIKPEFWSNQWEYESDFQVSNVNNVLQDYDKLLNNLNKIFAPQTPIFEPILYDWQKTNAGKSVHIPNSVQLNLSLWKNNKNLLVDKNFAYFLQNLLIENSIDNLIFFIPNQAALDRIFVKDEYDLCEELSSPNNISGGNQGSIACYLELDKKNKPNTVDGFFNDEKNNWQERARIEFRLASSSPNYNIYLHTFFVMIIALEATLRYKENNKTIPINNSYNIPRIFSDDALDSIESRYEKENFFKEKIDFFKKNLSEEQFLFLAKSFELAKNSLDNFIKSPDIII